MTSSWSIEVRQPSLAVIDKEFPRNEYRSHPNVMADVCSMHPAVLLWCIYRTLNSTGSELTASAKAVSRIRHVCYKRGPDHHKIGRLVDAICNVTRPAANPFFLYTDRPTAVGCLPLMSSPD